MSPLLPEPAAARSRSRSSARRNGLRTRIVVESPADLAAEPAGLDILNQQRRGPELGIAGRAVKHPDDLEAGIEPDEVRQLQRSHRVICTKAHRCINRFNRPNALIKRVNRLIDHWQKNAIYNKRLFLKKAADASISMNVITDVNGHLGEKFDYPQLRKLVLDAKEKQKEDADKLEYDRILWLSDTYHEICFSKDTDISDRVIFPISEFERKGIEDARFVRFTKDDGSVIYYGTYTAFDGAFIIPKLMQTTDFYDFKVSPLHGKGAQNKNLALFPKKINGKYAMMSRIDGWNNYLMYSDRITVWDQPIKLQAPLYPWEFIQIGNCGSPIETEAGWLIITHGVGPMRRYCLGASLLDLNDPSIEIGRLHEPLLVPNPDEREGYVPNVLYSCGSIIHNGELIIPYGLSDYCSSFATVNLERLLERIMEHNNGSAVYLFRSNGRASILQ